MMGKLPEQFPELYEQFMKGNFVVQTKLGTFNGVVPK